MIKFYVRTTLDRNLDASYNQIDYQLLVDYEYDPVGSFISHLRSCTDDCVILEDDLILCRDFQKRINDIINYNPNVIINFFEDPHKYYTTHYKVNFAWNQCTYYPRGLAKLIGDEMLRLRNNNMDVPYDILEQRAFKNLDLRYLVYRPCIVQHVDTKSLIQPIKMQRSTPYFIDYLIKRGISYDVAYKHDYLTKLNLDVDELYNTLKSATVDTTQ